MSFASGIGYDAGLEEVADFHGRSIARKVTSGGGGAEVTARVTVLEDLKDATPQLFDSGPNASDPILETRLVDEVTERKNLLPQDVAGWPPLEQGPLEGVLIAKVVIDREGKIRDIGSVLSDNPGLNDAARERIMSMRFNPCLLDGAPVQVVTTVTMPFKTTRPTGSEAFETARMYFEQGRKIGFLAAGTGQAYVLRAEFKTRGSSGTLETGTYTDTWISDRQWRREAVLGSSRVVRSRNGDKRYLTADGPDEALLRIVLIDMEPIPAIDTFVESDWKDQARYGGWNRDDSSCERL
jgi:Gram-negative bacterial TonB protein C-terminal